MGTLTRNLPAVQRREEYAVPLVYALLSSKEKNQYIDVLREVERSAIEYGIENCEPPTVMGDFEQGIINASLEVFPDAPYSGCFFHFCQSLFRKVVELGLKVQYNDPDNRLPKLMLKKIKLQ